MKRILVFILFLFASAVSANEKIIPVPLDKAKAEYTALMNDTAPDSRTELSWRMYVVMRLNDSYRSGTGSLLVSLEPERAKWHPKEEGYYAIISSSDWYNSSPEIPKNFDTFLLKGHLLKRGLTWISNKYGNNKVHVIYLAPDEITMHPDLPKDGDVAVPTRVTR